MPEGVGESCTDAGSGVTANTIVQMKGTTAPLPLLLILGSLFGLVVVALLVVVIVRGGGKKRPGGGGAPAPVVGYGAPGKGNTLLNHAGVRQDLISFTVDRNTFKHGKFLPGTHIPVHHPDMIFETRPDYVLILPWNLKDEIMRKMSGVRDFGARFVTAIPHLQVH